MQKPLMEKNYNEDIIRKKFQEHQEKEAHKILFMKALSSYKKLSSNKEQQGQTQRTVWTEDDLEKKKQSLYKQLETNKYRILEDQSKMGKERKKGFTGRTVVQENYQTSIDEIRRQQELKMEEFINRQQERRHAERLRYEKQQQQRRERQRAEYQQQQRRRREQERRKNQQQAKQRKRQQQLRQQQLHLQQQKQYELQQKLQRSQQPKNPSNIGKPNTQPQRVESQQHQVNESMEMPNVDLRRTNEGRTKQPSVQPFNEEVERKAPQITPKSKPQVPPQPPPARQPSPDLVGAVEVKTYERPKDPPKPEPKPQPKKQTPPIQKKEPVVQDVKKVKQAVPKVLPKARDEDDELQSITLEGPKPPPKQPQKKPASMQSSPPQPQKSQPQGKPPLPASPPINKQTPDHKQPSEQQEDIDEMKQALTMVGQTIGHATRDLKGIDVGWMIPCYFLYRKFYQLRQILLKQYIDLLNTGDATKQQIDEMKGENERIRNSLEKMSVACIRRNNNQTMKDKFGEKFELPVNEHLYRYVEQYVKEVATKDQSLSPENLLKAKLHLLEILNSLLVVQHFQGRSTQPLSPQQLISASTKKNIDRLLKQHLTEVRKYSTFKP